MRKAFNFFRSYFEIASELSDKDRLAFYDALILEQFTGQKSDLKGMAKFAYISQSHSINAQINGFNQRLKRKNLEFYDEPLLPNNLSESDPAAGGETGGESQEKGEEKVQLVYSFDDFWNLYNKKVDTKKCKDKFEKLSDKELEQIKSTLPDYIANTPDVQYRKNPLTYLNGKCWMDEIKKEVKLDWKGDPIL